MSDLEEVSNSAAVVSSQLADGPAAVSRAKTSGWCLHRAGQQGGKAISATAKRTNYFHPLLWAPIEAYMRCYGWSPQATVQALQGDLPTLFTQKFQHGHIGRLKQPGENRWHEKVLLAVERGSHLDETGRAGILNAYPALKNELAETLLGLRESSLPVLVPIGRAIMTAIIQKRQPDLLEKFKVSEWFELLPSCAKLGAPKRHSSSCPSS